MITYPVMNNSLQDYKCTENAFLPHVVIVPLSQDDDCICNSLVKAGDVVKEGQVIAKSIDKNNNESLIHSPIPGKVIDIVACIAPNGRQEHAIRIQLEGKFSYLGKRIEKESYKSFSATAIKEKLIEKGVINTFKINEPQNLGLQIKNNKEGENLIVRLFDEDPTRITDSLIFKFYFEQIVEGALVTAKACGAKHIVFAFDKELKNKHDFLSMDIPDGHFLEMNIIRYPSGTPREICSAFSRILKKSKDFTITKKDFYVDASTMYEVYKAVCLDTPSISKLVHFSGNCLYASCMLDVKIGTSIRDVINQLGGFHKEPSMVIINGYLSGVSVSDLDVPVTKYVKSVAFSNKKPFTDDHIYTCINCGNCRGACPVKLSPDILYNNAVNFREIPEQLEKSTFACIDCGRCNTVCPARLPLCQTISVIRERLINK